MQMPASPSEIKASFLPFVRPDYIAGMMIGDDLDSLLSAILLQERYGWPVAAVYCKYNTLWVSGDEGQFWQDLYSGKIAAIDLDIHHHAVPSLGHHILSFSDEELAGLTHTLNPNLLRGFSIKHQYKRKYPLSTMHLLVWLFQDKRWLSGNAEFLLWLSDSCYINAQRYTENVDEWCRAFFDFPPFADRLLFLQTVDFEENLHKNILSKMALNPLCRPSAFSNIKSRHLGLNGFQCQYADPNKMQAAIRELLNILSDLSGYRRLEFPTTFKAKIEGTRREISTAELSAQNADFAHWLEENEVFSYAFTYKDRLNYTTMKNPSAPLG